MKKIYFLIIILAFSSSIIQAKTIKYEFDINTKNVNITGKDVEALAINNQIPGPTIEATVGDTLEVTFNNKMDVPTSIHWHGVLLPNNQDGVPFLTTKPIASHSSFTYSFELTHHGTYWYHSHTGLQEQSGIYGSLIFHPNTKEQVSADKDYIVVLSDWTNENPKQVLSNLKMDGDYYALKKDSVQSWDKVLKYGSHAIKNRLRAAYTRMGPMDISDVGYDAFLSNGKQEEFLSAVKGNKVRIRLINAAASSYFNVEFANSPMTVVAADGIDIKPIKVKRLRMAIAETYDVIVNVNNNNSYELRATSEDGTGYSSTFIGNGDKIYAPKIPKPNLFIMQHDMHIAHRAQPIHNNHNNREITHQSSDIINYMTDYENLSAINDTIFDSNKTKREFILNLTGNMERYTWSFNNKTLAESDKIMIKKNEIVRFILRNQTMMHHPIHLHGHFFRVLNKQGNKSPLKHTVNVPPMGTVVIEFEANANKDWFFHCHNLYHMKSGMARVVSYEKTSTASPETIAKISHDDWYYKGDVSLLSNMTFGLFKASNTKNEIELEYDYNYKKEYDVELVYARIVNRFLELYAGGNFEREDTSESQENTSIVGIKYVLPMMIDSNLRINSNKQMRLEIGSDLNITKRTKFCWYYNTDKQYRLNLSYEINKKIMLATTYDSEFKWGLGFNFRF